MLRFLFILNSAANRTIQWICWWKSD